MGDGQKISILIICCLSVLLFIGMYLKAFVSKRRRLKHRKYLRTLYGWVGGEDGYFDMDVHLGILDKNGKPLDEERFKNFVPETIDFTRFL